MFGEEVGTIPCGFGASTTARGLHSEPSNDPGFHPTSQIWVDKCGGNGMMMDPYPHPQHMKVVNHLPYIWRWETFHVGLERRPLHKGFIQCQEMTQDFSRLPKSGSTTVVKMSY